MATLNHRRLPAFSVGKAFLACFAYGLIFFLGEASVFSQATPAPAPASAPGGPEVVSKVFYYGSANPPEVEDTVKGLISPNGKYFMMVDKQKVMVRDIPDRLEMISSLLAEMAKPQPNVRIELSFQEFSSGQNGGIQVNGNVGGRDVRVGNSPYPRNGINVNGGMTSITRTSNTGQFLVVQGGQSASIDVSKQVPFVDYFYGYVGTLGIPVPAFRWESVGTSMSVRPDVQGDQIRVEIVPVLTTLSGGRYQTLNLTQLATVVTVTNGVPVQIGGFQSAGSEFNQNFFSGGSSSRGGSNSTFTLKATVQ